MDIAPLKVQKEENNNMKIALQYVMEGLAVIPVYPANYSDASKRKRPRIKWKNYQERLPSEAEIVQFFQNGADLAHLFSVGFCQLTLGDE